MVKKQVFTILVLLGTALLLHAQENGEPAKSKVEFTHEFWGRGNHGHELALGNYVVVAQTISEDDAKKLIQEFKKLDLPIPTYGYQSNKGFWLVSFNVEGDIPDLQEAHKKYVAHSLYKSAWLLTVHE